MNTQTNNPLYTIEGKCFKLKGDKYCMVYLVDKNYNDRIYDAWCVSVYMPNNGPITIKKPDNCVIDLDIAEEITPKEYEDIFGFAVSILDSMIGEEGTILWNRR